MTRASGPSPAPPQPCAAVTWFYAVMFSAMELAFLWVSVLGPLRNGAPLQPVYLAMLGTLTLMLGWGFAQVVVASRVRLTEDGVFPNRRGHPEFVAWKGAMFGRQGFTLLVRNGSDVAEINTAYFCSQRALRAFFLRKFPPGQSG